MIITLGKLVVPTLQRDSLDSALYEMNNPKGIHFEFICT